MNPDYAIGVCFCKVLQLIKVRLGEIGLALAENAEYLRCFHPHLIILIIKKPPENRHVATIRVGRICSDVFRSPDKSQPDTGSPVVCETE